MVKEVGCMKIRARVEMYKGIFKECKALEPVKAFIQDGIPTDRVEYL